MIGDIDKVRLTKAIKCALISTRYETHKDIDKFCCDAVNNLSKLGQWLADTEDQIKEYFPEGWETRRANARKALEILSHSIDKMTPAERSDFVMGVSAKNFEKIFSVSLSGHISEFHDAAASWCNVILAMEPKATNHTRKSDSKSARQRSLVLTLAESWRRTFGDWPTSSNNSPFYFVVKAVYDEYQLNKESVKTLAPGTVNKILKNL